MSKSWKYRFQTNSQANQKFYKNPKIANQEIIKY